MRSVLWGDYYVRCCAPSIFFRVGIVSIEPDNSMPTINIRLWSSVTMQWLGKARRANNTMVRYPIEHEHSMALEIINDLHCCHRRDGQEA